MTKKNIISVLLIFISISLNAQYKSLFLSGVGMYKDGYYNSALKKFNASATCSDASVEDLAEINKWITKCKKWIVIFDKLKAANIEYNYSTYNGKTIWVEFNNENIAKLPDLILYLNCFDNVTLLLLYLNLTKLPKEIGNLTNLRFLAINGNNLQSLPKEIFSLKRIRLEDWEEMGEQLAENKNFKQALNCFLKITKQYTNEHNQDYYRSFDHAYGYAGWCYKNLGDTVNALLYFNKSFEINPNNHATLIELDNLYYKMNDYIKCIEITKKEIELKPTVRAYLILGRSYSILKNYNKAISTFKEALLFDKNAYFYGGLSYNYLFVNKPIEAIKSAKQTLDLEPKFISVYTNLALAYVLNNEFDKAKTIYLHWKDKQDQEGRNFKKMFLEDIQMLESVGIIHSDFEKVREILK